MNFLAHTLLSRQSPNAILGSVLGDFVKGPVGNEYPEEIRRAILLHRAIDRYTDTHPLHAASCALVSPERRRFAPILVDMFYDHFLARRWDDYCDVSLSAFAQHVYGVLLTHSSQLPSRLQYIAPRMAAHDWFAAYADLEGMSAAVNGIARRLSRYRRAAVLRGGIEELTRSYETFERHFREFFPQLTAYVAEQKVQDRAAA